MLHASKKDHSQFHNVAGKVVELVNTGNEEAKKNAKEVFETTYKDVSGKVVSSIQKMQREQEGW